MVRQNVRTQHFLRAEAVVRAQTAQLNVEANRVIINRVLFIVIPTVQLTFVSDADRIAARVVLQAEHLVCRFARIGIEVVRADNRPAIGNRPTCHRAHLIDAVFILLCRGIIRRQRSLNIFRAGIAVVQLYQTILIPTVFEAAAAGSDAIQTGIVLHSATQPQRSEIRQ